ncbi:MAG: hypothetical protein OIF55_15240 [Amphritea sp.]|nr:hypothetical protein [Amphritea sp.]
MKFIKQLVEVVNKLSPQPLSLVAAALGCVALSLIICLILVWNMF